MESCTGNPGYSMSSAQPSPSLVWTVPDFTVDAYADRLRALHGQIEKTGPFVGVTTSARLLIEARKPI